jgi:hypothetical protein
MLRSSKLKTQNKRGRRAHQGPQDRSFDPQSSALSPEVLNPESYLSAQSSTKMADKSADLFELYLSA